MCLLEYVTGLNSDRGDGRKIRSVLSEKEVESETYKIGKVAETLRLMNLSAMPEVRVQDQDEEMILGLVPRVLEAFIEPVRGSVVAKEAVEDPKALHYRNLLVEEFKDSSMSGVYPRDPPVRGPFGEAEINLRKGAENVSIYTYRILGEGHDAHTKLVEEGLRDGKLEMGKGAWNTPSFPVPKKKPGAYRLVQDFRPQNEATEKDGHPMPRIMIFCRARGSA